jgi:large subunit ribosomal protein L18
MKNKVKQLNRSRRHKRVRADINGTSKRPRISVFKSNKGLTVQLIDDENRVTVLSNHIQSTVTGSKSGKYTNKTDMAKLIGELLAGKAREIGISEAVFDRGGYKYHGRIKALADGLRAGGLKF